ncbi:hypothetical protein AGMMS49928_30110 [Spirochaetia bacterium]|nr:hypothetical protein AGMMS49928_30110 [Spirochaetia bacterium]
MTYRKNEAQEEDNIIEIMVIFFQKICHFHNLYLRNYKNKNCFSISDLVRSYKVKSNIQIPQFNEKLKGMKSNSRGKMGHKRNGAQDNKKSPQKTIFNENLKKR